MVEIVPASSIVWYTGRCLLDHATRALTPCLPRRVTAMRRPRRALGPGGCSVVMSWGAGGDDEAASECMVLMSVSIAVGAGNQTETVPARLPLWGVVMRFARKPGRVR